MGKLEGKVAIVTGSGRGIGKEIAIELARQGADVVVNYMHSSKGAQETVREIEQLGRRALSIQADVSDNEQIKGIVARTISHFQKIDILVNNAAVDPTEDFLKVTEEFWNKVIDTNLKGTFFCTQACAVEMMKVGGGKVINISSVHGHASLHNYAAYASTKGGINAMTRQMSLDLAKHRINVNAVAPGAVEVEKYADIEWYDRDFDGRKIPWGRIGTPADIAPMVAFLASGDADFITGQVIVIDGGSSARFFFWSERVQLD